MAERDAFGREKDEDTLADMGWRGGLSAGDPLDAGEAERPFAKPKPVQPPPLEARAAQDPLMPTPPPAPPRMSASEPDQMAAMAAALRARQAQMTARTPAPASPPRARRGRGPSLARLLIFVTLLAIVGIGGFKAVDAGRSAVGDIKDRIDDTVKNGQVALTPPAATPAAKPKRAGSFLVAANLRAGLRRLPHGRVVSPLRVDAKSIDAQIFNGPSRHIVTLRSDGTKIDTKVPLTGPQQKTLRIDPAAPARFVRATHHKLSQVDYLVLLDDHWVLFLKNGRHYEASTAGTHAQRIG